MDIVEQWSKTVKEAVKMYGSELPLDMKEDYEQECFIKILEAEVEIERILSIQGETQAKTFVFVMCKNKILNLLRDTKKETSNVSLWDSDVQKELSNFSSSLRDFGVDEQGLDEAVKQLPAAEQHVVRSLFFQGQTEDELAKSLGETRYFVRQIKDEAIKHLRKILEAK